MKTLVWDAPVRVLHWLLAGCVLAALAIALLANEHSLLFSLHPLLGLTAGAVVLCRLVWGVVGTRHARFAGWKASPAAAASFVSALLRGRPDRAVGHNPLAVYAIAAMLGLTLALAVTGLLIGRGIEAAEEIHEVCAYLLLATVGLHLAGVLVHVVIHRENIVRSLVDGRKEAQGEEGIPSARTPVAFALLVLIGAWAGLLLARFDPARRTISIPGIGWTIALGESGDAGGEGGEEDD